MSPSEKSAMVARELGIDAEEIARRKSFLQLDKSDVELLKSLQSLQQHYEDDIATAFFDHLLGFAQIRDMVPDEETLVRLRNTLATYFRDLISGEYNDEYVHKRLHVGIVHKRVGLDPKWYLGAYRKYLSDFLFRLWKLYGDDHEKFLATFDALLKVVLFDIGLAIDTYHHADKQEILQFEKRLQDLLDGIDAVVWEADTDMRFTFVSHQAQGMLGYPLARWTQEPDFWREIILPEDRESTVGELLAQINAGRSHEMDYRVRTADGGIVWIHGRVSMVREKDDGIIGLRGLMVDITALKDAEKRLVRLASYDELTGLPNRSLLQDRLRQAMVQADRSGGMVALLYLDLDRFKNINDSLGHDVGDGVLQTAAGRLIGILSEVDTVARSGGDEFMILLPDIDRIEDITLVANNAIQALAHPFTIGEHELFVTVSVGISVYPRDGKDVQTLLKDADAAMYRAKEGGKNRFEFFTGEMNAAAVRRLQFENMLRQALIRNEFVLHYQPQADLSNGKIVGVEALVRWQHPDLGVVPPVEFIPLAEETGMILPLGEWIMEAACRQAVAWRAAGLPELRMAVNVSVRQFAEPGLVKTVERILRETGLAPSSLKLEMTESLFMQELDEIGEVIDSLRRMGVRLSVDDFGTGYSSLSYLRRFPVTSVKIDQSFIQSVTSDPASAALVRSIIGMAHELRLRVIAEGVETEAHLHFLANHHCDEIQGFLLSRPMTADDCAAFIQHFDGLPVNAAGTEPLERVLLLVDDEPNITMSLKRLLRSDGYRILTASSGKEGLDILANHRVGVIVSDQRMPVMTGVEFFGKVKDIYPDTIRIVLSGYTELKSVTDAINEGAIYKFLTKPWDDEQLRAHVREAFQRYELKLENARLGRELERANSELSEVNRILEKRVAEKTETIRHNIGMLQVSQEILEHLPAAVIGLDDDGLVVIANRLADALLAGEGSGSLLGFSAEECLPPPLVAFAREAADESTVLTLADGRRFNAICHRMGEMCRARGCILVFTPIEAT
jgi:diguanylate cyclase (GGDEF)-like protein/PAS domain S-box-containing protein